MAIRYAVATGNWSDTTTWDGGTLPTVGDDVYDNSFTVTINQDIEVNKISTELCPTTLVGGGHFVTNGLRTYICDVYGGLTNCVWMFSGPTTVIGNVYASDTTGSAGMQFWNTNIYNCNPIIYGNVYGRTGVGIQLASRNQSCTVYGDVYAGTSAGISLGEHASYYRNLNVTGVIYASPTAYGATFETLNLTGNAIPTAEFPACYGPLYGVTKFYGTLSNVGGTMAIVSKKIFIEPTAPTTWLFQDEALNDVQLYTVDAFDQPGEENVRDGVEYGSGTYEGTLVTPDAENVVRGVPVGDTVGTYELSGDIVTRLEHCSTVETTGAQITGFQCP